MYPRPIVAAPGNPCPEGPTTRSPYTRGASESGRGERRRRSRHGLGRDGFPDSPFVRSLGGLACRFGVRPDANNRGSAFHGNHRIDTRGARAPAGWLSRFGWSGKLFVAGGLIGFVAAFLPLISFSMEMMGLISGNQTVMVVDDWRGKVSLAGYVAALVFAFLLYPPGQSPRKPLLWIGIGSSPFW